ncbi:MAG: FAD:protein FMN transferase [Gammaproteobacteria bacterium]|nr:FAD:protein FMN transferase [Gammaproteobacteria bacterium]MBU1724717.1 FAD:protein FMN transferase [Gammaproteobacteria bacterium]MBU2006042.1 FAD:protein FMN transferase [Gammaproteobacteria bacterium]
MNNRLISGMPAIVLAFFIACLALAGCEKQASGTRLGGMQGTAMWHVTISDELPGGVDETQLMQGINAAFAHSGKLIAGWDKTSEISRFNQYAGVDWFPVSPELVKVVATALELSRQSDGAYDVTVGPLIELWGFSAEHAGKDQVPSQAEIDAARARVGSQKLEARLSPPALRKLRADVHVELASLADGFAADLAGEYLESQGIHNYMVEIAGEIRTRGVSPRGDAWQIAIEKPLESGRAVQQGIHLGDAGLATSGDYRNFFMQGGKRYSHTIDPHTGFPVTHNLASVSVVAESGMLADAYATLLMSLGEEKGKLFAEQRGLAAYFIWRTDSGFGVYSTKGFSKYF